MAPEPVISPIMLPMRHIMRRLARQIVGVIDENAVRGAL